MGVRARPRVTGRRVLLLLSVPLGVGAAVASNQVLTDDGWSWVWTGVALAVATAAALVAYWLTRPPAAPATTPGTEATTPNGERSVVVTGDNSGIISTGDGATNIQQR
ncbi:hypothetical protein ACIBEJ_04705 [Nonomuraea sp. NPDC050790]|uniref:hypothetical protein n=1 Tax=Nonomuraea sp. NPDC050790 TaxID=3364371 RepID=UPI00378BFDD6